MKKYIYISLIMSFMLAMPAESQRRTAERSTSRKVESTARNKTRKQRSAVVKKSGNERPKAVRQTSRSRSSQRAAAAWQATRSSSSGNAAVARQSMRNNTSAARQAGHSSSSPSRSAVQSRNSRNTGVSTNRSNQATVSRSRGQENRRTSTASTANVRNRNSAATGRNRETVQRRSAPTRDNRGNTAPARAENRNSGSRVVYRSTRRYVNRHPARHVYVTPPRSREYRAVHFPYRRPARVHVRWSVNVFRFYVNLYPVMRTWTYYPDYRFEMISAYNALFHIGELRTVYGKVTDTYYARETDEYFLYFGAYYPYHDFTVVLPGNIARRFSWNPERYFRNDYIMVTGLITEFEGKPEIVVKHPDQIRRY